MVVNGWSLSANCEEWFFDHPRFGTLPCERTKVSRTKLGFFLLSDVQSFDYISFKMQYFPISLLYGHRKFSFENPFVQMRNERYSHLAAAQG